MTTFRPRRSSGGSRAPACPSTPSRRRSSRAFVGLLLRWNRVHNLTGVRGAAELVDRHLVESLALRPHLRGARVADVGSGGGLPGLPLAITEPDRAFTLIESRAKRVHFLRHAIAELGLRNSDVAHGRAEHLRVAQPFDTVLARAVAPPAELLSICRPLMAPGSILLLLTAPHLNDEFRGLAADFVLRPESAAAPEAQERDRGTGTCRGQTGTSA